MRLTRPILAAFMSVLVLAGFAALPATAARPVGLKWAACTDDPTAKCAKLRVPVDWSKPYGSKIDLAVARRTATDPKQRIGALIVNPGGPGGSGVDFALGAAGFFSAKVRARFDVVGFDPRGVARSNPVLCAQSLVYDSPSPVLAGEAAYRAAIAYNKRLAKDCRKRTGPVFDHLGTRDVVRDMEALRVALGEERISFYGASYGTLLGAHYAQAYPLRTRAVVLDSVMDQSAGLPGFLAQETTAAQDMFDEFVAWCARDRECVLRGQNVRALWGTLRARARQGKLVDPYDLSVRPTEHDLIQIAFDSFYDPQYYSLAVYIKEALATAAPGTAGKAAAEPIENGFPAIFCTDWDLDLSGYAEYATRLAALRTRAPDMQYSPLALGAVVGCQGWPVRSGARPDDLRPAIVPTLLINSRHDPATGYAWARHVTDRLGPQATLVTYYGWGHVVYSRTACVNGLVDTYLLTLRRPPAGTSCPGVMPDPFGIGKRAPLSRRAFD